MSEPAAAPRHRRGGGIARVPIVGMIAALLLAGGIAAGSGADSSSPAASARGLPPVPVAAPVSALSSSWFCAGATDSPGGAAPGEVVIANAGPSAVEGAVTLVPSKGRAIRRPVTVGRYSRLVVPEQVPSGSPWIGAIVDMDGGGVAVEQLVSGPVGYSEASCAVAGSSTWYFPTGATRVNQDVELCLLNPYPTVAVVDLTFTTDHGIEQPQGLQGLVVPAGGLVAIDLRGDLPRRSSIATTVVARAGRVVAWKTEVVTPPAPGAVLLGTPAASAQDADPAQPVSGVTLSLGAPSAATSWVWPAGDAGGGVEETYAVYNPGPGTASVRLAVELSQGSAEPFYLSVGPDQLATVKSTAEARIPPGVAHAAVLTVTNGVPVVAERTASYSSPSPLRGRGELLGGRLASRRWLLPALGVASGEQAMLTLLDTGRGPAAVRLVGLDGSPQAIGGSLRVSPGRSLSLGLPAGLAEPVVVESSRPIFAEVDSYRPGAPGGVALAFGIPVAK